MPSRGRVALAQVEHSSGEGTRHQQRISPVIFFCEKHVPVRKSTSYSRRLLSRVVLRGGCTTWQKEPHDSPA